MHRLPAWFAWGTGGCRRLTGVRSLGTADGVFGVSRPCVRVIGGVMPEVCRAGSPGAPSGGVFPVLPLQRFCREVCCDRCRARVWLVPKCVRCASDVCVTRVIVARSWCRPVGSACRAVACGHCQLWWLRYTAARSAGVQHIRPGRRPLSTALRSARAARCSGLRRLEQRLTIVGSLCECCQNERLVRLPSAVRHLSRRAGPP